MWKEFKSFAMKGNVFDLAVGVIIGGAFGKIVSSLVGDMLMPLIGILSGGLDLTGWDFKYGDSTVKYGTFLQTVIDFFIVAFTIFLVVKGMNRFRHKEAAKPATPPAPSNEEKLLMEIRDLLKEQRQSVSSDDARSAQSD